MSTLQTRTSLILPDDGGPGGDDTINVTTQLSDSIDYLSNAVGIFDYTGAQPSTGNFVGRLVRNTATGAIYRYDGSAFVIHQDTRVQPYSVVWHSNGTLQPAIGNGSLQGYFFRYSPELVRIWVEMGTGSTTVNGRGDYDFSVPPNASLERTLNTTEQQCACYIFLPWAGWVPASGKLQGTAMFPLAVSSQTNNFMSGFRNCDGPGNVGTGIPQKPGDFTLPSAGGTICQISVLARMS